MFQASADSLDDLMRAVFKRLLAKRSSTFKVSSRKGNSTEIFGALIKLTDPRARLGRSMGRARIFSPLGELMWYLSGSNALDFIQYYIRDYHEFSDDGVSLNGAYGPRIFSPDRAHKAGTHQDQWQRVIETLKTRNGTRNAIIQIFANDDAARPTNDVPCTCTLHFVIRDNNLWLHAHMRSNDAFLGLPHDIFSFTMLQEIAARELGVGLGCYLHSVASLHLYDDSEKIASRSKALEYVDEGLHDFFPMPPMPAGNPWHAIRQVLEAEERIRNGDHKFEVCGAMDAYWSDIVRLLKAYAIDKSGQSPKLLEEILSEIASPTYRLYVQDRIAKRSVAAESGDGLFKVTNAIRNV